MNNENIDIKINDTETTKSHENNNYCNELKHLKYKNMILNGVPLTETNSSNNLLNLDKFLEEEKNNNKNEPWSKLNKTIKTQKLMTYVEKYKQENELNIEETELLVLFFKDCLDNKKIYRVKDVIYDKEIGVIKEIPALVYNKLNKHFTLKNIDKRISTLKSLPPKKTHGTIKNKLNSIKID